ncbi:NAD(P)-binding protein [Aspergillus steynii IBT 23096]|uniref:NAD(P)-binding protein n=1 Tax=Aspergillus steynii IBT 23096 TaxID=1392250 RepID=A0A2I2GAE6_9EURO|nr:NAD(P)-binding protein [Aspergillus steynii IBT 23096]PLB49851.1 NAD(P)-binding protein [Aspergillus steynii IBT 23096]
MSQNILITGGSGYLGGTVLARWTEAGLLEHGKLFSLVRTDSQAEATRQLYGAEPLRIDLEDEDAVKNTIVSNKITIVLYLIDAYYLKNQIAFIRALAETKKQIGQDAHFIYTTGTKQFSSLSGSPIDRDLVDNEPHLFDIHKAQNAPHEELQTATDTNIAVVEAGIEHGVKIYVFSPCIVYGKGEGFGNKISIQTVDVVIAATAAGRMYEFDQKGQIWPVSHVLDTVSLYFTLLDAILKNKNPGHGKNGFYLASSGKVAWHDIYAGIAKGLARRGKIPDERIELMNDTALEKIAKAQKVSPSSVIVKIGGRSTYTAANGKSLGWMPQYPPEHILESLDKEVEIILEELDSRHQGTR